MNIKNNYNECITNLACSIRKYFGLEYKHNTLEYVDRLLNEKKPKNVVVILFDGMGSRILKRALDKDAFFLKNMVREITTVFPATTTAATISMRTGLNPVEHGYLGWYTYIEPLDKTIKMFFGTNKEDGKYNEGFTAVKKRYFNYKEITEEINDIGKYRAVSLFPFGDNHYKDLDDMLGIIEEECKSKGKKYIYAYDEEPDYTMHDLGPDSNEVIKLINKRSEKVEKLCANLDDTIVFVIADHGHIVVDNILLDDYPELMSMLERTPSLEERAVSFKVKEGMQDKFVKLFSKLFGEHFNLYTKEEIIGSKLFGDGVENPLFKSAIGDFIAIATDSNKALVTKNNSKLFSQHAGYSDDEIYIPLIIINRK